MNAREAKARAYLHRTLGFPETEIDEILRVGRTALSRAMDDLERALDGDAPVSLSDAAHAVKGVLRNLGLEEEAGLARQVEERADAGSPSGAREAVCALRRRLAPFLERGTPTGENPGHGPGLGMDSAAVKA